ncbi:domain found in IF2B/IF5-domain-containing protein [Xylaria bambusicola]|uniref:domain found in IF2B/IF5-domain-containing protein n=1 Tax=Xylaria bambusicola TaxID=326684 RepID=UPI0020084223|nr:domain found in IF2B/IF5-domain-containing protein [Xylaria bambusicola]KAI0502836.1 domain found in IF2B/IF5-domain-containing protein [Xylaria bambusicola]
MDPPDTASEERPNLPDRKSRKSVVFSSEAIVVQPDGQLTMSSTEENKEATAISHSTPAEEEEPTTPPEDGGALDLGKKKKKKPKKDAAEDGEAPADDAAAADGGIDPTLKKKKKKKPKTNDDEFAAKLAALNLDKEGEDNGDEQAGDPEKGTGIWQHDQTTPIPYSMLLDRFYSQLAEKNPDHASTGSRSYKIPPPQCLREGNKKTIFANIEEITKRMKRSSEHVTAYLFTELGTTGSVDGSKRLVIKGRFQQKQLESMLRKYIIEYVTCRTCKSPDTTLEKGENRLYFMTCNSCGSRRSVTAIKSGFTAQVGKRKKMQ